MLQEQYIEKLMGLEDVIVTNVEQEETEVVITLERKVKPHRCPCCNRTTSKVHDF